MTKCKARLLLAKHQPLPLLQVPLVVLLITLSWSTDAFQINNRPLSTKSQTTATALGLIPLTKFKDELDFFSTSEENRCCIAQDGTFTPKGAEGQDLSEPFEICIVEESDLPEVTLFIVKAFGADAISLSSTEFSAFEKGLVEPVLDFFNGYYAVNAFAEVLWGLRLRNSDRLLKEGCVNDISAPNLESLSSEQEKIDASNRKSLILVMARPSANTENNSSKWTSVESNVDVIASVELRLQPCDAKIPFSLPWWDAIERKIAAFIGFPKQGDSAKHLQPYLSTLCVDETYRGQQIGRAMVRCLEDIVAKKWGYSKVYLHVDGENEAALKLYQSEGYRDVGRRWNPFWAGRAADIGYFVKKL